MKNTTRKIDIFVLFVLGWFLIEIHSTFINCLLGIVFWAVAATFSVKLVQNVPGIKIFSGTRLAVLDGKKEWGKINIFIASFVILALVGISDYCLKEDGHWGGIFILFVSIGWLFFILENHSPVFWSQTNQKKSKPWYEKLFLPEIFILAVGSFFLFSPFGKTLPYFLTDGNDTNTSYIFATKYADSTQYTTPYMDATNSGSGLVVLCGFPYWCESLFLRIFGVSQLTDVIFYSLLSLIGLIFFYKFLCFCVSKKSAFLATVLLSASHWAIMFTRQTYVGIGFVIPLLAATLYFFARTLEFGKARDFAILGALLACDLMAHLTIHLSLFYFVFVLLLIFFSKHRLEILKQRSSWLFTFAICAILYLPMFVYFQQHGNPWCLVNPVLFKQYDVHNLFPWRGMLEDFQMLTLGTKTSEALYLPYLSPWESIFWICGFAWCLWHFYKPPFVIIFIGLFAGFYPDVITNQTNTSAHRAIAALPFIYLFIGIGIDRLEKVITAPLGKNQGTWVRYSFLFIFLIFSVLWQYDFLFHQFSRYKPFFHNEKQEIYSKIAIQHRIGWDIYTGLGVAYMPDLGTFYPHSEMSNRISSHLKDLSLPLKNVPAIGTLVLLGDESGKAMQDWISYYYPDSPEKIISDSFGLVQYRYWEITSDQIRKALQQNKGFPNTGLILTWYDHHGRQIGKWHVPTPSADVLDWDWVGSAPFDWQKVAYFMVNGYFDNADSKVISIETTGKITGKIGKQKIELDGFADPYSFDNPNHNSFISLPKGLIPIRLKYIFKDSEFKLGLLQHNITGWDLIPSNDLKTTAQPQSDSPAKNLGGHPKRDEKTRAFETMDSAS